MSERKRYEVAVVFVIAKHLTELHDMPMALSNESR